MLVTFSQMPNDARVWIYQSDKPLDATQINYMNEQAATFCDNWAAHNTPLKSAYKLLHDKFFVIAVDEGYNNASGCSIDSSVHFVKAMEQQLGVNFFDRSQVAFLINDNVYTTTLQSIKEDISGGKIVPGTLTFNTQVQNVAEFQHKWLVPAEDSWLKRYF